MADPNIFTMGMNAANADFAKVAGAQFEVVRTGVVGVYDAISIDNLASAKSVIPGGLRGDNTVLLFVTNQVLLMSQIKQGTVLKIRGANVRVNLINDDDDEAIELQCGTVGAKI